MPTEKVSDVFMSMLNEDLVEDRREYQPEDHSKMYGLNRPESEELFQLIQERFDPDVPDPSEVHDVPPGHLHEYLVEYPGSAIDGWSNQEQLIILELFRDIVRFSKNCPDPSDKIHLPVATDNRDMTTTIVTLDNGYQVEINPIDIFRNMLENMNPPDWIMHNLVQIWEESHKS